MPGSPVMITNHSLQWIEAWLVHQHQCSGFGTFWSQASMYTLHYCNNIIFLKMLRRGCWKHDKSGDKKQTQSKNYSLHNLIIISDRYSSSQAEAVWMAIIRVLQMSSQFSEHADAELQLWRILFLISCSHLQSLSKVLSSGCWCQVEIISIFTGPAHYSYQG